MYRISINVLFYVLLRDKLKSNSRKNLSISFHFSRFQNFSSTYALAIALVALNVCTVVLGMKETKVYKNGDSVTTVTKYTNPSSNGNNHYYEEHYVTSTIYGPHSTSKHNYTDAQEQINNIQGTYHSFLHN